MNKVKTDKIQLPSKPSFLIILMGSLGDVSRGFCLVSLIKGWYPQSTVTWLIEPQWTELIRYHPMVDRTIVFDRPSWRQGLVDVHKQLRSTHFDCVLDLQRHLKSGLFSFFSRAKYRIGFHPKNSKEGNWLFNNIYISYQSEQYPKIFHYLEFIKYLGIPLLKDLNFGLSNIDIGSLNTELAKWLHPPFLAIILGSTWQTKEWFFDQYFSLIQDLIYTTRLQIVLLDAKSKLEMACSLDKKIDHPRLVNLVGMTSVLELAAILKQACLAVGPDCGAGHLSSAVGTPYVSLFGPTSPERTAPYGSEYLVVKSDVSCSPCYKRKCPKNDRYCMREISVKEVKGKIFQGLNIDWKNVD
ncbi:MAG TPA: glycosyltransferase family 9 protein [Desulfohalobiaceae bacterium]|nr:glycosyltransferase family 9 protein [Desulfohalobiaceae bacterium]